MPIDDFIELPSANVHSSIATRRFIEAAKNNDNAQCIDIILHNVVDINAADEDGQTPLMIAIRNQNLPLFFFLLDVPNIFLRPIPIMIARYLGEFTRLNNPELSSFFTARFVNTSLSRRVSIERVDAFDCSALDYAIDSENLVIINELLNKGSITIANNFKPIDVNRKSSLSKRVGTHIAPEGSHITQILTLKIADAIEECKAHRSKLQGQGFFQGSRDVNANESDKVATHAHYMTLQNRAKNLIDIFRFFLLLPNINLYSQDSKGDTLVKVIVKKCPEMLGLFIKEGCYDDSQPLDDEGNNPLHILARANWFFSKMSFNVDKTVLAQLLGQRNKNNATPLDVLFECRNPLQIADWFRHLPFGQVLNAKELAEVMNVSLFAFNEILKRGDIKHKETLQALHSNRLYVNTDRLFSAYIFKLNHTFDFLISPTCTMRSPNGNNILHNLHTCERPPHYPTEGNIYINFVKAVSHHLPELLSDRNKQGDTPLLSVIKSKGVNIYEVVEALLICGADPNDQNRGISALEYAKRYNQSDVCTLLLQHCASENDEVRDSGSEIVTREANSNQSQMHEPAYVLTKVGYEKEGKGRDQNKSSVRKRKNMWDDKNIAPKGNCDEKRSFKPSR